MAEIVIAGAGPAGIAAAVSAASAGAAVTLLDDNPTPGGQIWRGGDDPGVPWFERLRSSGVRLVTSARIVAVNPTLRTLTVETQESAFVTSYSKLILATGARELFLPFPGWTAPNVLGVGGLQALAKSGFSILGKRIVVAGTGPFLLAAAAYFHRRGAVVPLIAEQASRRAVVRFGSKLLWRPTKLAEAATLRMPLRKTRYLTSCWVERASAGSATVRRGWQTWREEFDYLAVGYGFRPNTDLAEALGCGLRKDAIQVGELQQTSTPDIYAAGECTGIGGVDSAIIEGQIAGLAAGGRTEAARKLLRQRRKHEAFAEALNNAFSLRRELRSLPEDDTIICRCEDVRWSALRENRTRREAKLYTRCGMGPCQGRICGPILDFLRTSDHDSIRPPIFPARLDTLTITEELISK
jgi:NADPH-dependent 2,4-dienoyl-CoA reductase/sulfur reductase-like enzyme